MCIQCLTNYSKDTRNVATMRVNLALLKCKFCILLPAVHAALVYPQNDYFEELQNIDIQENVPKGTVW